LTHCGLEVKNPTQALKSVTGPGQYLSFNPSVLKNSAVWNLQEIYIEPNSKIEVEI